MPSTAPIEISFVLNSSEVEQEFKRIVSGSKTPDQAIEKLENRFKQLTAAQVLGAKGAEDVAKAMKNVKDTAKSTKLDDFGVSKQNIKIQKQVIKGLEDELKKLQKQIDGMAPGRAQMKVMGEANKVKRELEGEKKALKELDIAVSGSEEKHQLLTEQMRHVRDEMAEMQIAGKKNTAEYEELAQKATEYQQSLDRVRNEVKYMSRQGIQGLVQGLGAVTGGFSAAQGAVGLFAGENENLQKIMVRVQSLMAVTIGLQQISEALDKRSAFSVKLLSKAKKGLVKVNTRLATSLGITNAQAVVLMGTLTLGLSVAIAGVIYLFQKWNSEQAAIAEAQKEFSKSVSDALAEPLISYRKLQAQWTSLNGDLEKQKTFVNENRDAFEDLGKEVNGVSDAEEFLVDQSEDYVKAMELRAKATAAQQIAVEKYKESLEKKAELKADKKKAESGNFLERLWYGRFENFRGSGTFNKYAEDEIKDLEEFSEEYLDKSADFEDQFNEIWKNLGLKTDGKRKKKKADEFLPPGSVAEIKRRIKELDEALGKATADSAIENLKDKRIAASKELAAAEKKIEIQSVDEAIEAREKAWDQYYAYAAEHGKQAADKQFAGIKKEAGSFYEWLEKQKTGFAGLAADDDILTDKQKDDLEKFVQKLNELSGKKSGLEAFTQSIDETLEQTPVLVDQLEFLDRKIQSSADKKNFDNGKLSALFGKREDIEKELQSLTDEFVTAHRTLEQQKTDITKKYMAIRAGIEERSDLSVDEKQQLKQEALEKEQLDIEAAEEGAKKKRSIFEAHSRNMLALTKNELKARQEALNEYLEAMGDGLNEEEEAWIKAQQEKLKALQSVTDLGVREKQLLQEKKDLLHKIAEEGGKGKADQKDLNDLTKINSELSEILAKKAEMTADIAGRAATGFHQMANAVKDTNSGLADTLDSMGDILEVAQSAATAVAGFASGNIAAGIGGAVDTITQIVSIGSKAREATRKAREEIRKWQKAVFEAGMDYNKILRDRLKSELEINDAHATRLQQLRDEMALSKQNMDDILGDMQEYLRRLLKADVIVGKHTKSKGLFGWGGKKTVNDYKSVADLLGLPEDWNRTLKGQLEEMFGDLGNGASWDNILDALEELNAKTPFSDDAKDIFEAMEALRDEYGSLAEAQEEWRQEMIDTLTGTTVDALTQAIADAFENGQHSINDFANNFQDIMRNTILNTFMMDAQLKDMITYFQNVLAGALDDGELTEGELDNLKEIYDSIGFYANDLMDQLDQAGIGIGDSDNLNSLQGAYKAASQESIDLLAGNTAALRLSVMDGNSIMSNGFSGLMESVGNLIAVQMDIEANTGQTATNTNKLYDIHDLLDEINNYLSTQSGDGLGLT